MNRRTSILILIFYPLAYESAFATVMLCFYQNFVATPAGQSFFLIFSLLGIILGLMLTWAGRLAAGANAYWRAHGSF
jgi:hypothetical protein